MPVPPRDSSQDMPVAAQQIPRATLQALTRLNQQMEALNSFMVSQTSPSQTGRIEGEQQSLADRQANRQTAPNLPPRNPYADAYMGDKVRQVIGNLPGQVSASASTPPPTESPYVPTPSEVSFRERLSQGKESRRSGSGFNAGFLNPEPANRIPPSAQTGTQQDEQRASNLPPTPESMGGDNRTPSSAILGMSQDEVAAMRSERLKIPEFGDWQLDTKLKLARDLAGRFSMSKGTENPETGEFEFANPARAQAANVAGYLNQAQGQAASIYAAKHVFDKVMGFGQGMQTSGEQLGYSPQSGIGPSSILGFRNPLSFLTSAAGQQGGGMALDAEKMSRLGTGITDSQAKSIYGSLAGQGFSNQESGFLGMTTGGDLENVATRLVAPIVKNTGMNAETASGFADALRNGNTSIKELSETLNNLPDAAQSAREGINQYGESLQEFAQGAEQFGATKQQGYQSGLEFTNSTGLDPRLLGQMQSNPLFQGLAMTQMGVLPSGVGALPGGTQTSLTLQAMKMAMGATAGMNHNKYQTINGKQFLAQTGNTAQEDQAAQLLGMSPEEFKRLNRNQGQYSASANAETLLKADTSQGWGQELAGAMQKSHGHLTKEQRNRLQHGGDGVTGWNEISKQLLNAGVSKNEVSKIANEGFDKRTKSVEEVLAKKNKENINESGQNVQVKFTGAAAKFFEQVSPSAVKSSANAGGPSITSFATSPLAQVALAPLGPVGTAVSSLANLL